MMVPVRRAQTSGTLTAKLRFGVRLIDRFSRFSEDINPVHINRLAARRSIYGERVSHGMLVVLWALACLREGNPDISSVSRITGNFRAPVRVGDLARLTLNRSALGWHAVVRCGSELCATFQFETCEREIVDQARLESTQQTTRELVACRDRAEHELLQSCGQFCPMEFDPGELFKNLVGFDRVQCRMLAGLSRLVGMECPGLHSTLLGFDVELGPSTDPLGEIVYRAEKFDSRFKFLSLKLLGGVFGRVDCLVKPAPVAQLSMVAIKKLVPADLFIGGHALVVGGSRGIGEVIAKGFVAGGGRCTLTYATGAADAGCVIGDINSYRSGLANAICWNVEKGASELKGQRYTHCFFLASPPIRKGKKRTMDGALYRRYRQFYVAGLEATLRKFSRHSSQGSMFIFASSEYVELAPQGFSEYAKAKYEGEQTGKRLGDTLGVAFHVWRLPRLHTDQTMSLAGEETQNAGTVIAQFLKDLVCI